MIPSLIFLYGPPGSGKSTLGQRLARSLDLPFHDLDEEIERETGLTIPEIFAQEGEAGFRKRERESLLRFLDGQGVISLGGGALLDPENRRQAEAQGQVLTLEAPARVLTARLGSNPHLRPLLSGDLAANLEALLASRQAHYASFSIRLDTASCTPEEAAWEAQVRLGIFNVRGMPDGGHAGSSAYVVRILSGGIDCLGEALDRSEYSGPAAVVSDGNVGPLYAGRAAEALQRAGFAVRSIQIPAGEQYKTLETAAYLWSQFLSAGIERGGLVAALGGGVVSDLAGFTASAYLRGVRWAALPTSLLSMVDAALGGKTGVDLPQGKNLVGAFYPPQLVLSDPQVLATLPEAELLSGMAEVVKHGVIGDPQLFALCASLADRHGKLAENVEVSEIVRRAVAVKIRVIEADPYEQGLRTVLNLGHTVGHALETASYFRLRHGEAVAIGMVAEARLSERIGLAEKGLAETIAGVLRGLGLQTEIPPDLDRETALKALSHDKKRRAGAVRFALPVKIGEVQFGIQVEDIETIL